MFRRSQLLLHFIILTACFACILACNKKETGSNSFEVLDNTKSGIDFANRLKPTRELNMFNYMYFYNGSGVGAGDFNNDGLIDLFFASNQGENKLYLNKGNLKFEDISTRSQIPQDGGWSTGVSVVDINNDGLLDIYVCRVGNFEKLKSKNQFLICHGIDKNGIPIYKDDAIALGLDFSGFSTQAAFFDYDSDGDLDMFLMNHSLRYDATFGERMSYNNTYDSLTGDRIYRNDKTVFTNVTRNVGINGSIIGYGLGIANSDINLDGYPDIYVGNDFHENDYLYINQKDGTFKDELTSRVMHTSQFSMGVDVADVNNDALPEIVSADMMPADPYILKRSFGGDEYNLYQLKLRMGYFPQYAWNNLQYNRGNGMFSDIARYAGIYATDWSWAPLWMDFDNDGLKDLFISNGIPKRLNDIDYVNFASNEELKRKIATNTVEDRDMALISKFPEIKLPNKFFRNMGKIQFDDIATQVSGDKPTYSNGAVYADLDNDGDLDVVVNNIDDPALIYQNLANDHGEKSFAEINLKGPDNNIRAVGSKLFLFSGENIRLYEKFPVRGFQSSMEIPMHIGLDKTTVDSLLLVWPDNTYQKVDLKRDSIVSIAYQKNLPSFNYDKIRNHGKMAIAVRDVTVESGILHRHVENPFVEFDREPLIPHMISREGPALATGDLNGDGKDDVFIGSAKREKSAVFVQTENGNFTRSPQPQLESDSTYEDVDGSWVDLNNDKAVDLVVASGGNEYYGKSEFLTPRIYINNKGQLERMNGAFDSLFLNASCVVAQDFTGDGYPDLFIGARSVPYAYGQVPNSYLLENDKTGKFKDVTSKYCGDISNVGFVTGAAWCDIDKDGDQDLVVSLEWDGVCAFISEKGRFVKKYLTEKRGWWNFILPCDVDQDGDLDFIAGNLGLNSRLHASKQQPVKMYYNDFDNNGSKEQVLTYYLKDREICFASKSELEKQMPVLKKQFLYAENFAKASLDDLFGKEKLSTSTVFSADYFSNAVLINEGNLKFTIQPMPWQAQLTTYRDAAIVNANEDNLPDILLVGNYYHNNIQMGSYDADFGTILLNKGAGNFECAGLKNLLLRGEVRHIRKVKAAGRDNFVLVRNNDSSMVIQFGK